MNGEFWHLASSIGIDVLGGILVLLVGRSLARRDKAHEALKGAVAENAKEIQRIKVRLARCKCANEKADD